MKILVSGATEFIGKNLVKRLLKENNTVHALARPSTDLDSLEKNVLPYVFDGDAAKLTAFMQKEKFDGVVHLASLVLPGEHTPEQIKVLIDSNVLFATLLLEASAKSKTPWFINTGTFWQHYEGKKYSPVNLYAATKQAFEDIAEYYIETTDIDFVTIKLNDTFGPFDTRPKIFNLWTKIDRTGEKLAMSPGEQIIDMSHVDNIVDGYMHMTGILSADKKKKQKGKSFFIHSDERMPLKKLARVFERLSKGKLNIDWGGRPYRLREVMVPCTGEKKSRLENFRTAERRHEKDA